MNPYLNRGAIIRPEDFFGRVHELGIIYGAIENGTCISLVGERRIGKTSILNMLKLDRDSAPSSVDYGCIAVDGQYHSTATEAEVVQFILDRLEDAFCISSLEPTLDSLRKAAREVRRTSSSRLVITLDEVGDLARNPRLPKSFFSFLRAWSQEFRIVLVTAAKESSIESLVWNDDAGSPFWNIFKTLYVGPLCEADALMLIREPALAQGIAFSEAEVRLILGLGGHQPFFLQVACDHAYQARVEQLDPGALAERVSSLFCVEATPHLEHLWGNLTRQERGALSEFASGGVPPRDRARAELLRKGVLLDDAEGLRIFSRAFAKLIRETLAPARPARLLERMLTRYFH
jgi:hypothetical protein